MLPLAHDCSLKLSSLTSGHTQVIASFHTGIYWYLVHLTTHSFMINVYKCVNFVPQIMQLTEKYLMFSTPDSFTEGSLERSCFYLFCDPKHQCTSMAWTLPACLPCPEAEAPLVTAARARTRSCATTESSGELKAEVTHFAGASRQTIPLYGETSIEMFEKSVSST